MCKTYDFRSKRFAQLVGLELKANFAREQISQAEIAEALSHSKSGYSRWLNAKPSMPLETLLNTCLYIHIDPSDIINAAYKRLLQEFNAQNSPNKQNENNFGYTAHIEEAAKRDDYRMNFMDINEATAKALSAERAAADLTIKDLSAQSGVPERTLIRLLKNERDIKMLQVAQIADALGILPHKIIQEAEQYIKRKEWNSSQNTLDCTAHTKEAAKRDDYRMNFMDINEATAKALQAARAVSGMTFEELSEKSGVPIATLFRIFGAQRDIKVPQLYALTKALGITIVELFEDADRIIKRENRNNSQNTFDYTAYTEEAAKHDDYRMAAYRDPNKYIESQTPTD